MFLKIHMKGTYCTNYTCKGCLPCQLQDLAANELGV